MARFAVGTAGWGQPYGLLGKEATADDQRFILRRLAEYDPQAVVDRADDYGPSVPWTGRTVWKTRRTPTQAMLHATPLHCAMLHLPADPRLLSDLVRLKQWGAVEKVGVSAYDDEGLWRCGSASLDAIQVPLNVFDVRMLAAVRYHHARRCEVHVRSVFLQGLLFMDPDQLPDHLAPVRNHLWFWHRWREAHDLTVAQAAIGPLLGLDCVDHIVLGINDPLELEAAMRVEPMDWRAEWAWPGDPALLDPRTWRTQ